MLGAVQRLKALSVSLLALNRICATISSFALYVYFAEFYPTAIRATSLGFANALSRFGGMLATYVSQGGDTQYAFFVYALAGAVCSFCTALLKRDTLGMDIGKHSDDLDFELDKDSTKLLEQMQIALTDTAAKAEH